MDDSPPGLRSLDPSDKDALIVALLARVEELCVRVAALEAKTGLGAENAGQFLDAAESGTQGLARDDQQAEGQATCSCS